MVKKKIHESGQILLITLLVVSVAVTIVLSLVGRATTDVAISNQIIESSRAFNAAEAGIEQALKTGAATSGSVTGGASYTVTKTDIGGSAGVFAFPNKTTRGQSETVWLAGQDGANPYVGASFDVCWSSEPTTPAMVISIVYKTAAGSYRIARAAFDPDLTRGASNNFSPVGATSGGCGDSLTTYKQTVTFASLGVGSGDTVLLARITPLYSDSRIEINTQSVLPLQGSRFESTSTLGSGVTRKVVVFQLYRSPPSVFDNVIYSQGDFSH